jgi:N-acylneuraminate cytidylyltransferase
MRGAPADPLPIGSDSCTARVDPTLVLAVIPARGGSKGIPRKNLRLIGGQPLVVRTIEQAHAARRVGRVVVSTDDPEIAAAARHAGADIVQRPSDLSGDEASSESALLHALQELERTEVYRPQLLVFLQCSSPLTRADDIDGTVDALVTQGADCAFAAVRSHGFLWRRGSDAHAVAVNHDASVRPRRQEREPEYLETGAVYVMRVDGFRQAQHRFFGKTVLYEMPRERGLEVDDPADLRLAEVLLPHADESRRRAALPDRLGAVVFDFDGVLTDNRVLVHGDGTEAVWCSREDGWGIGELRAAGVPILVLSSEPNPVVRARCEKLGVECLQGHSDKLAALRAWTAARGIDLTQVVFVGNDRNDLPCLRAVGCGAVVNDAHASVTAVARLVLTRPGGRGAVREMTDLILTKLRGAT